VPIYAHFFVWASDCDPKVGQIDLVFDLRSGFINRSGTLYMQDYKSLCAAVTICSTLHG